MKTKRGGSRPGAGRPKIYRDLQARKIYMPKHLWDAVDVRAEQLGISRNEFFRRAARRIGT